MCDSEGPADMAGVAAEAKGRVMIVRVAIAGLVFLLGAACSSGEDRAKTLDWACINSVGWLLGQQAGHDVREYELSALDLYDHAQERKLEGEKWDLTEELAGDLYGWYQRDNEVAVKAFVDVNDCMQRSRKD